MQNNSFSLSLLFRRIAAFLYDCLLLVAIFFVITAAALFLNDGQAIQHSLYKVLLLVIAFLFFDWFWRHGGQTLGMRAWRIRVEGEHHPHLTFTQSAMRFASGALLFGFTLLAMPFSSKAKALHDTLSDTKIVRDYK